MDLNFGVFQEPRGVMRVIHFIFSICAFATITGYYGYVTYNNCHAGDVKDKEVSLAFSYPFQLEYINKTVVENCTVSIIGNFASDARFFVATGVLAFLYSIIISVIYVKFDEAYRRNNTIPLADFVFTVFLGILWLSSSGAWANGLSGLKSQTDPTINTNMIAKCCSETILVSSFSTLNISVVFGFLNFFLWAADLWFLYKETAWFLGARQQQAASSGV